MLQSVEFLVGCAVLDFSSDLLRLFRYPFEAEPLGKLDIPAFVFSAFIGMSFELRCGRSLLRRGIPRLLEL